MRVVFRNILYFFILSFLLASGCKKSGSGSGGGSNEANLVVTTNPPAGSVQPASTGPFNLTITITSPMPPGGVKIEVTARREDNNTQFFSQTINNTSTSTNNFSITNTPANVTCVVDMKVTSNSRPSNQWTGSYRYSRK
ncbi:MAG: hypothetical protein N2747_11440 [Chitinophagaceae bacterium]|nr:hypothetical protein [Chitinophagaceae bacterium]